MRATSRRRTTAPSSATRSWMAPNCSGVSSRFWAMTVKLISWPGVEGRPPIWPAEISAFWASIAALTSAGVRL